MLKTWKLLLVAIAVVGLSPDYAAAQKTSKNPPPPPPPPPPVTYALQTFKMPVADPFPGSVDVRQMSSDGVVVGYYTATHPNRQPFIYFPGDQSALDLNRDFDVRLNDGHSLADAGLRIVSALGINNFGYIVGPVEEVSKPGVWRGYLLDLNTLKLTLLPAGPGHSYARQINDRMDILGVTQDPVTKAWRPYLYNPLVGQVRDLVSDLGFMTYPTVMLNNPASGQPAQVVGQTENGAVFRYIDGHGLDKSLPLLDRVLCISSSGMIGGAYPVPGTRNAMMPYRFDVKLETFSDLRGGAWAITDLGDFVCTKINGSRDKFLYHEGAGLIDINTVLSGSTEDRAFWDCASSRTFVDMTERGEINPDSPLFPGMCGSLVVHQTDKSGRIVSSESRGFLLVPQ
jgi:hypothetical protein